MLIDINQKAACILSVRFGTSLNDGSWKIFHILRNHFQGAGVSKIGMHFLFSQVNLCLCWEEGGQKSIKVLLKYVIFEWFLIMVAWKWIMHAWIACVSYVLGLLSVCTYLKLTLFKFLIEMIRKSCSNIFKCKTLLVSQMIIILPGNKRIISPLRTSLKVWHTTYLYLK